MAEAVIRVGGDERYRFHVSYGEAVDVEINGRKRASCRVAAAELKGNVTAPPAPPTAEVAEGVDRRQERHVEAMVESVSRLHDATKVSTENARGFSESALESAQAASAHCGQTDEMVKEARTLNGQTAEYRDQAERYRDECREITQNYGEQSETIQELRAVNKLQRDEIERLSKLLSGRP